MPKLNAPLLFRENDDAAIQEGNVPLQSFCLARFHLQPSLLQTFQVYPFHNKHNYQISVHIHTHKNTNQLRLIDISVSPLNRKTISRVSHFPDMDLWETFRKFSFPSALGHQQEDACIITFCRTGDAAPVLVFKGCFDLTAR